MTQNYNLSSKFGLNVTPQSTKTYQGSKKELDINPSSPNLFDSMSNYFIKNENVFNGDVAKEINMYSRQAMIVGMNLKATETKRIFDVNI